MGSTMKIIYNSQKYESLCPQAIGEQQKNHIHLQTQGAYEKSGFTFDSHTSKTFSQKQSLEKVGQSLTGAGWG